MGNGPVGERVVEEKRQLSGPYFGRTEILCRFRSDGISNSLALNFKFDIWPGKDRDILKISLEGYMSIFSVHWAWLRDGRTSHFWGRLVRWRAYGTKR